MREMGKEQEGGEVIVRKQGEVRGVVVLLRSQVLIQMVMVKLMMRDCVLNIQIFKYASNHRM